MKVRVNNTLNKKGRVRKDCVDDFVGFIKTAAGGGVVVYDSAPGCPLCGAASWIDLTTAPSEWSVPGKSDASYNRRYVMECAACHLVCIEDYWGGVGLRATLHLVQQEP